MANKIIEEFSDDFQGICDYGCGRFGKFKFSNGKICCENHYGKCEAVKQKFSKSHMGQKSKKNGLTYDEYYGSERSKEIKSKLKNTKILTLKDLKEKYPELCKIESFRTNPENEFEIQGICKNCGEWFNLTYSKIYERFRNLKTKANLYFFCSEKCKKESKDYYSNWYMSDPKVFKQFMNYKKNVIKETERSIRENKQKIKNIDLRGNEFELDHKYSIHEGFKFGIDPKILGHWKNLRILTKFENRSKHKNCSITLAQLLNEIGREKEL